MCQSVPKVVGERRRGMSGCTGERRVAVRGLLTLRLLPLRSRTRRPVKNVTTFFRPLDDQASLHYHSH
jgi:hypothetical protein